MDVPTARDALPNNWSCKEFVDDESDGALETNRIGSIEGSGYRTINDKGESQMWGLMCPLHRIWTKKI